jgi:hypothetical protein
MTTDGYISKKKLAKDYYEHKRRAERFYQALKDGKKVMVVNHHDLP